MGKSTGFLEYEREDAPKRPVAERVGDFREIELLLPEERLLVLAKVLHALGDRALRRVLALEFQKTGDLSHGQLKTSSVAETVSACSSASRRIRSSEVRYSIGMTLTK